MAIMVVLQFPPKLLNAQREEHSVCEREPKRGTVSARPPLSGVTQSSRPEERKGECESASEALCVAWLCSMAEGFGMRRPCSMTEALGMSVAV